MSERKVLVFKVGDQEFGVDIGEVREVINAPIVTALPKAEAPVLGVFNLRGSIVTALDGGAALGVGEGDGARSRAVVADIAGYLVGVLVDSASEVLTVAEEDVRPAPYLSNVGRGDAAVGVILQEERAIVLLGFKELLAGTKAPAAVHALESASL